MEKFKKKVDSEFLQIKAFQPSSEGLPFLQMVNFSYCQQDNGKKRLKVLHNFVHLFTERTLLINQHLLSQRMENLL